MQELRYSYSKMKEQMKRSSCPQIVCLIGFISFFTGGKIMPTNKTLQAPGDIILSKTQKRALPSENITLTIEIPITFSTPDKYRL